MTTIIHRRTIYERDGAICGFCKAHVEWNDFDLDHVVPQAIGGKTTLANLRVAHKRCNRANGPRVAMQIRSGAVKNCGRIVLYLPPELHARLWEVALRERRPLSTQIEMLVERALAADEIEGAGSGLVPA